MYDSSLKYKWDNKNVLDYAIEEAAKKADSLAREEERIKAFEEKITIAREMKKDGLPLSQISKFTRLSIEEIEKL
jgi:predicted transposase YdaD